MPQPDVGDVHVNALLTQLSIAFSNETYIADQVFPQVLVEKQVDIIPQYDRDMWLRSQAAIRAPGTVARRSGWDVTTSDTYKCLNYALGHAITVEEAANADGPFNLDRDTTAWLTEQILLVREVLFAATAMVAASWTNNPVAGVDFIQWTDYANSNPIVDVRNWRRTVRQLIARAPNVACMGEIVFDTLIDHPNVLDRIRGAASPGSPAIADNNLLAQLFRLDKVVVANALQVTSAEGAAAETRADIVDDDFLLVYVPSTPSLMVPAAGYSFIWRAASGGGDRFMRRYEETKRRQTVLEAHTFVDYHVTAADAGLIATNAA